MVALHSSRFSIYFAKTNTISIIHNHRDRSKERNKTEPIWYVAKWSCSPTQIITAANSVGIEKGEPG
jgi:hypothetical protein